MPNHDTNYYMGLDKLYNGTRLDYDEALHGDITSERQKISIRYWLDKRHSVRRFVDLTEIVYIDKITLQRKFNIH